jgi:2-keto-3-deoxy-galactonokinase
MGHRRLRKNNGSSKKQPMRNAYIAINGGTTNTRARVLADSRLLAMTTRNVGVRDSAIAGSAEPIHHAVNSQ